MPFRSRDSWMVRTFVCYQLASVPRFTYTGATLAKTDFNVDREESKYHTALPAGAKENPQSGNCGFERSNEFDKGITGLNGARKGFGCSCPP